MFFMEEKHIQTFPLKKNLKKMDLKFIVQLTTVHSDSKDSLQNHSKTSSKKSRLGRNDLFTRILFRLKKDWRFEYNSHYRFSERCYLNRIHINKWLKGRFNYGLMVDFFGGTKTAFPYGRWRNQSRAIFSMRYKF